VSEVHPIEAESYRILYERVDLSAWRSQDRAVVARIIHATADESFAASVRIGDRAVDSAVAALRDGAPVVCDAKMVLAGMNWSPPPVCLLDQVPLAPPGGTRSAAAIGLGAELHPEGAVFVIGNAPTALAALIDLYEDHRVSPAAVVGLPVGYVGAAEAKERLWASPLGVRSVTNLDRRGGSPAAAGAFNAIARLARA
jgi:precorrin-8X/cobalt-precorrin-8 methylmutase